MSRQVLPKNFKKSIKRNRVGLNKILLDDVDQCLFCCLYRAILFVRRSYLVHENLSRLMSHQKMES